MSAIEDWLRRTDYQESQETEADQGSVSAAHNLAWLNLLKTECSAEDVREDLHAGDTVVKAGRWDPPCVEPATTSPLVSKPLDSFLGADRASYSGAGAGSDNRPLHKLYSVPYHSKPVPLQLSATSHSPSSPGFGITWDEAEHAIEDFTSIFTAHFPFIILDHDITARRLIVEKPLLFLAILMITVDFTTAKSLEIRTSIDAWIGQHLLVMEDQSLGALQGLIVYCAWYTYCESGIRDTANELTRANPHFYSDHRATQLMYLAVGLAHSLGITRQAAVADTHVKKESEINEEHRTFLACFYVLSFNSFQFGRSNPLASSYVQHCVDSLERSSEFPTDFLLIKLVNFRLFIGRIPSVYDGIYDMNWCREGSVDAACQLDRMRKYLEDLMSDVTHHNPKFLLLWTLHHSALLQLHLPMTYVTPDTEEASRLQNESMQHCLEASRMLARMVKSFSPDGMMRAPFTTLTDLFSMFIGTSRLLLLEVDGWDLKVARESIDFEAVLDDMMDKLTRGSKAKAEKLAAAAVTNPTSYMPDRPNDEKQDRLKIVTRLIELIKNWLCDQGVIYSDGEDSRQGAANEQRAIKRVHVSPQNPQWNFTYFFESLLQVDRHPAPQN